MHLSKAAPLRLFIDTEGNCSNQNAREQKFSQIAKKEGSSVTALAGLYRQSVVDEAVNHLELIGFMCN